MGISGKFFGGGTERGPSETEVDQRLYQRYLLEWGGNMKMARTFQKEDGKLSTSFAKYAIDWGIRAYHIKHPIPPEERSVLDELEMLERRLPTITRTYLLRQFGREFADGYGRFEENQQKVGRGENGELVKESIEIMEKLSKRIREMLGLSSEVR